MSRRCPLYLAVASFFLCLAPAPGSSDELTAERKKLEGTWVVESASFNGTDAPLKGGEFTFAGKMATMTRDGEMPEQLPYRVNPTAKPATIDFGDPDTPMPEVPVGLYQLAGDELKLCLGSSSMRPKAFTDPGCMLLTLKRKKATASAGSADRPKETEITLTEEAQRIALEKIAKGYLAFCGIHGRGPSKFSNLRRNLDCDLATLDLISDGKIVVDWNLPAEKGAEKYTATIDESLLIAWVAATATEGGLAVLGSGKIERVTAEQFAKRKQGSKAPSLGNTLDLFDSYCLTPYCPSMEFDSGLIMPVHKEMRTPDEFRSFVWPDRKLSIKVNPRNGSFAQNAEKIAAALAERKAVDVAINGQPAKLWRIPSQEKSPEAVSQIGVLCGDDSRCFHIQVEHWRWLQQHEVESLEGHLLAATWQPGGHLPKSLQTALSSLAFEYGNFVSIYGRSPANLTQFRGLANVKLHVLERIERGEFVVQWNLKLDGTQNVPANAIVAYHRAAPAQGGWVSYGNGRNGMLSAQEFQKRVPAEVVPPPADADSEMWEHLFLKQQDEYTSLGDTGLQIRMPKWMEPDSKNPLVFGHKKLHSAVLLRVLEGPLAKNLEGIFEGAPSAPWTNGDLAGQLFSGDDFGKPGVLGILCGVPGEEAQCWLIMGSAPPHGPQHNRDVIEQVVKSVRRAPQPAK